MFHGSTQPECALAQIHLPVGTVEGPVHEGGHGGIRQIDSFVLRRAAAFPIGMELTQLRQQLANGALPEVKLDLERLVFACQHQFPVPIAGQAACLHINPQMNLHGSTVHTISGGTKYLGSSNFSSAPVPGVRERWLPVLVLVQLNEAFE